MSESPSLTRTAVVQRGRTLEYFTIAWNTVEGLVAIAAGVFAGSISLVGFGIDSFIEVTSGSVLLWRMSVDANEHRRAANEKRALRFVGVCFLLLAVYVAYESATDLWLRRAPEHSIPGIILACVSLVVMPLLSRAKRKVGRSLGSAAMHADAKQTEFCTYLSSILLLGLLLNTFFNLWWADPVAALIMIPIIVWEGIEGVQGVRRLQVCLSALLERPADATISLMLGRHRSRYSRAVGVFLVTVFAVISVTASICPVCLARDFLPIQHTAAQNLDHHPDSQNCDRDGCSCCGFHFLAPTHDLVLEIFASTPVAAASIPDPPPEVSSGFYRPPRA